MNRTSSRVTDLLELAAFGLITTGVYILAGVGWALLVGGLLLAGVSASLSNRDS